MSLLTSFSEVLSAHTTAAKTPLIIFTDPGVDDLLMLLQILAPQNKYKIAGIIPVRGNGSSQTCLDNTLSICEYLGRTDVKVYPGKKSKFKGFAVYGKHALNGLRLPPAKIKKAESISGIIFAYEFLKKKKAIIVSTAGLTEPAEVLNKLSRHSPLSLKNILGISLMGGVINTTQEANYPIKGKRLSEANVADDPTATKKVFDITAKYNIPIFLSTLDLTHSVLVSKSDVEPLRHCKNRAAKCAYKLITNVPQHYRRRFGKGPDQYYRQPLHDVHASCCLLHPELYYGRWVELNRKFSSFSIKKEGAGNVFLLSTSFLDRKKFINDINDDYANNTQHNEGSNL